MIQCQRPLQVVTLSVRRPKTLLIQSRIQKMMAWFLLKLLLKDLSLPWSRLLKILLLTMPRILLPRTPKILLPKMTRTLLFRMSRILQSSFYLFNIFMYIWVPFCFWAFVVNIAFYLWCLFNILRPLLLVCSCYVLISYSIYLGASIHVRIHLSTWV